MNRDVKPESVDRSSKWYRSVAEAAHVNAKTGLNSMNSWIQKVWKTGKDTFKRPSGKQIEDEGKSERDTQDSE